MTAANHLAVVTPAQRHPPPYAAGTPVFAGIHVFLAAPSAARGEGREGVDVDGRDKP
jgi:hypothetical protein